MFQVPYSNSAATPIMVDNSMHHFRPSVAILATFLSAHSISHSMIPRTTPNKAAQVARLNHHRTFAPARSARNRWRIVSSELFTGTLRRAGTSSARSGLDARYIALDGAVYHCVASIGSPGRVPVAAKRCRTAQHKSLLCNSPRNSWATTRKQAMPTQDRMQEVHRLVALDTIPHQTLAAACA